MTSPTTDALKDTTITVDPPAMSDEDLRFILEHFFHNAKTLGEIHDIDKRNLEAVYSVAYTAYQSGQYEQAGKLFQFLCILDHLEHKYWLGLGGCRQRLGDYGPAIHAYAICATLDAEDPQPPLYAAECYLALGDREAALSGLQTAIAWSEGRAEQAPLRERAQALRAMLDTQAPPAAESMET